MPPRAPVPNVVLKNPGGFDNLELTGTSVIAEDGATEPTIISTQGMCLAVKAILASAKDTAGVEFASVAKKATTTKPEA